jgi:hypothetical protein
MPIENVQDSVGMTYEDAVSLHLDWGGQYPLIEATSHLIKKVVTPAEAEELVHVNVQGDGSLRPCLDHDGFDAVILPAEAERLGFIRDPDSNSWRLA